MLSMYTAMSGMAASERALANLSNEIANQNSIGYLGQSGFFHSLAGQNGARFETYTNFGEGELIDAGNDLSVGVVGNGFFIVQDPETGFRYFTKDGALQLSEEGGIIHASTGYEVLSFDEFGNLNPMDVSEYLTIDPVETNKIDFSGRVQINGQNIPNVKFEVFNSLGERKEYTLRLTRADDSQPRGWDLSIMDGDEEVATSFLQFNDEGVPTPETERLSIIIPEANAGSVSQDISLILNFGTEGDSSGTTTGTSNQNLTAKSDGNPLLGFQNIAFLEDGRLKIAFEREIELEPFRLALAHFDSLDMLKVHEGSLFKTSMFSNARLGTPSDGVIGQIESGKINGSNVPTVEAIGQLILVQRNYQANSSVLRAIEGLLEETIGLVR